MPKPRRILGGPQRDAFDIDNVIPTNFTGNDPYAATPGHLNTIDKGCKSGDIKDLIIISRWGDHVKIHWRGTRPLTTALGMLEYAKELLYREVEDE